MGFVYPWFFSFRNARLEDEMAVGKNREAERRECRNQ